jgi:hypothetical protein
MATLLLTLNLAALAVIWAAAMFYYLRHGAPECAGQHYGQIALILIAVGAFATGIADLRTHQLSVWAVMFRVGIAMVAARYLARAWRQYRAVTP